MSRKSGSRLTNSRQKEKSKKQNQPARAQQKSSGSKKIGNLVFDGYKFQYYCLNCSIKHQITKDNSIFANEVQIAHRVPICTVCRATIGPIVHKIQIDLAVQPDYDRDDLGPLELFPKGTFDLNAEEPGSTESPVELDPLDLYDGETGSYAVIFANSELRELLVYLAACPVGELSVPGCSPVLTTVRPTERDIPRQLDMNSELNVIRVVKAPSANNIDLLKTGSKYDDQRNNYSCRFGSVLELLTFLDDYGGTLLMEQVMDQDCQTGIWRPTIVLFGREQESEDDLVA